MSLLSDHDVYLFKQGKHVRLYDKLGAHARESETYFAVWAPNAERVSVIGEFNRWNSESNTLTARKDGSGIWEGHLTGLKAGMQYKYHIASRAHGYRVDKGDPFAFYWQTPPETASVVWNLDYAWGDDGWMQVRRSPNALDSPMAIYEVHLGSWRRVPEQGNRSLSYRELAESLPHYLKDLGFTHVEFLPVMEHPFYGSWGYQTTGYFAPSARYGTPQDFMFLVDTLHQNGIGVILDWVPSHFPSDEFGLSYFDGTYLFEHADRRQGFHPEWNSYIFNYGRHEVRSFLLSSAMFWLEKYHVDGIRVDAVASMLYLDYARKEGEWIPNPYGGRENIDAITFLKDLNEAVYRDHSDTQTIAEESTAWPMVSRPTYLGGLGFGMKWNMGWMHDTLDYFSRDAVFRKYHHGQLTFSIWYAFSENFVLPLSHDEVVYGKGSLIGKMPGDDWQKFAQLRLLFGYMWAHPGKKLLFMGGEFAQWQEWNHDQSLSWHLLEHSPHQGMARWLKDLNRFYREQAALYQLDFSGDGFEWIDFHDWEESAVSFVRKAKNSEDVVLVVCNFTPVPRFNYVVGVPRGGFWRELLNSDAQVYGGSGLGNFGGLEAAPLPAQGRFYSLSLTLPPLAVVFFKP
jgi:1,4-alpha-glucan branching enzyme